MRVLVAAADVVGERMGGVGIRAWELSRALARAHEVTLLAGGAPPSPASVRFVAASRRTAAAEVANHDVIVAQGTVLRDLPALAGSGLPLVVDLYDPFIVEGLEFTRSEPASDRLESWRRDLEVQGRQLELGDLFLCASERQRYFCLGLLAAAGRLNPLTHGEELVAVVPFGLPDEPAPARADDGAEVVVWAGGIWNWLDPLVLVRAAAALAPRRPQLQVRFLGSQHPNPSLPAMSSARDAVALSRELGLLDRVVFFGRDWVPYAERGEALAGARIGVSFNPPGVEAELAFRTRCLDYLWAGLPMVVTDGDSIADLVRRRGLGLVVPPGDAAGVADALERLLEDGELAERCRAAAAEVREEYRWSRVVRPLSEFCNAPRAAADRELRAAPAGSADGLPWRRGLRSLRRDGPGRFATRTWRYLKRRWA